MRRMTLLASLLALTALVVATGLALADTFTCHPNERVCSGTKGNDTITGTEGGDNIRALRGEDEVAALAGNDIVSGGDQDDHLAGGRGDDYLRGGRGDDYLRDLIGDDVDELYGNAGDDWIDVADGDTDDFVDCGRDTDTLRFDRNSSTDRDSFTNCENLIPVEDAIVCWPWQQAWYVSRSG